MRRIRTGNKRRRRRAEWNVVMRRVRTIEKVSRAVWEKYLAE